MDCERREEDVVGALRSGSTSELFTRLGYEQIDVELSPESLPAWGWGGAPLSGLRVVARTTGVRVVEGGAGVDRSTRRSLALAVHRSNPLETVLWVWVDDDELSLAIVARRPQGRAYLRTTTIDREEPDAVGLDRLRRLRLDDVARPAEPDAGKAFREHLLEVLDQDSVTREFFDGFRDALTTLQDGLIAGPDDVRLRYDVCLVTLLRLVFLYFLQREGLLAGDRRYLVRRLRTCVASGADWWATVLRPLFFGVLNTPADRRDAAARALGEIPFLNGGLFEPTGAEREHSDRRWPNDVWQSVLEGVFERFHFTATEPGGDDEAAVVDPEMLGKVFEGLMYGDERHRSGSFYTPRDVVRSMVDEVLDAYLDDVGDVTREAALSRVRILDPAVGTGAFLLEALNALRRRRRQLGLPTDYAATRRLIHDHLFGVDRQRTAVRLCELRLWLAMLGAMREEEGELPPLPNLSHRIAAGDSLLAMREVGRFRDRDGIVLDVVSRARHRELERHLDELQREYLQAHSDEKRRVRRRMDAAERALQEQLLVSRRSMLVARLEPIRRLEASDDLFGESMASSDQVAVAERLSRRIDAVDEALAAVRSGRTSEAAFAYESRFGMAAREGFDIIVTNPPWVRALRLDPETKASLKTRYETASNTLWRGARDLGVRAPFGTQPDLAALFIERSMELLRPGGRLCALVPSKLFRSLGASALRRLVSRHEVERLEDLSEADRQLFDATTYPAVLRVRKCEPRKEPNGSTHVTIWRGDRRVAFRRSPQSLSVGGSPGAPWLLVPDEVDDVFATMWQRSVPLGTVVAPRRGIFTGANDVFIRSTTEFERSLGPDVGPWIRPVVTGSGLGEMPQLEIIWPYDESGVLAAELPGELVRYFEENEARLRSRSDFDPRLPLWQMFRVREDTLGSKVAWRDLSVFLEPVRVSAESVPLNTVYYVPCATDALAEGFAAWMSSTPVRAYAYALAERARGGWRRHFAWVVRMLPLPKALLDEEWRTVDFDDAFGLDDTAIGRLERWLAGDVTEAREAA